MYIHFMMSPEIPEKFNPRLDHVGIAVEDIDSASEIYVNLGLSSVWRETVENQGVEVMFLQVGESQIELLTPLHDDSLIAKFLKRRGPGLHHIAFRVENIREVLDHCIAKGIAPIDAEPRRGAGNCLVAFLHPKSTNGVLIELTQNIH